LSAPVLVYGESIALPVLGMVGRSRAVSGWYFRGGDVSERRGSTRGPNRRFGPRDDLSRTDTEAAESSNGSQVQAKLGLEAVRGLSGWCVRETHRRSECLTKRRKSFTKSHKARCIYGFQSKCHIYLRVHFYLKVYFRQQVT
jgi:hypothetical protein